MNKSRLIRALTSINSLLKNCGAGGGPGRPGFQPGNSCARGGGGKWVNPNHRTATDITGKKPADGTPLKTMTLYHVTKLDKVDSILKNGFDLTKVKPRWKNDYAVSATKGKKQATAYFSRTGQDIDETKYALLEIKVKGRYTKTETPVEYAYDPQDYNKRIISKGLDGQNFKAMVYVHNVKSIASIEHVPFKD